MSWFARSIANTLRLDDDEDDDETEQHRLNDGTENASTKQRADDDSPLSPGRGVKEDLSEITQTLTRQFWGVASFLAPPPPSDRSSGSSETSDPEASAPEGISGIRRDFAEIGGRFRSGISKLSNNIDVTEITKLASNFLQIGPEDEDYDPDKVAGAVGVTDEVVAFVKDIAMHPETWLDFPLPEEEDDDEDFELSDAQQEHALAVERLAPRLAALRIELCPGYMSEGSFWKIYFVLLHPRLERHAAELLSTPEIVKARASLTYELKNRSNMKSEQEGSKSTTYSENIHDAAPKEHLSVPSSSQAESVPLEMTAVQSTTSNASVDMETEKHPIPSDEIQIIDKSVIQEEPRKDTITNDQSMRSKTTSNIVEDKDEDDADDWLKEESSEIVPSGTTIPIENDEDVSFSDLEEDDDGDAPSNDKRVAYGSDSSTKDSRDWVQLGRSSADSGKDSDSVTIEHAGSGQVSTHNSETKESNDWLDVDDIDVA